MSLSLVRRADGAYRPIKYRPFDGLRHRAHQPISQRAHSRARQLAHSLRKVGHRAQQAQAAPPGGVERGDGGGEAAALGGGGEGGEGGGVGRQVGVQGVVEELGVFHGDAGACRGGRQSEV